MNRKAFVLLSGGMDSTTCLFKAIYDFKPNSLSKYNISNAISAKLGGHEGATYSVIDWVEAISVDYGQRHKKEFDYARKTCDTLGIEHRVLSIGGILSGSGVMLTDASVPVPNISYSDIKGVSPTYVPYRNGTLLSLITAHAQKWVNQQIENVCIPDRDGSTGKEQATAMMRDSVGIYFGAHSEDAAGWAYPDCTPEFIGSQANAIYTGTYYTIRLYTPLQWLMKKDIVLLGESLNVPWAHTWSCYRGEEKHCGVCPTCRSRCEAFQAVGVTDPTEYAA